ncbi:RmlC-like cupin [Thozetella sp. PMI_491]|nr:RmlC-like cupin [Thozetella sp. PMI_491]
MALQRLITPPKEAKTPYVVPCFSGELWSIPTSNSVTRLLVTGEETENQFAVVTSGGTFDDPILWHFHREAHDIFLCLQGTLNVWADDKGRSLGPGDFASVPPGTVHRYQVASEHCEFAGLIVPGGWEEFFRFVGEPYEGPLFPTEDKRSVFEVLVPRMIAATEKFDVIPVPDKAHFDVQPWDGTETKLPGTFEKGGYFLREGQGDKWILGGLVARPIATTKESGGKFSLYDIRGSVHFVAAGIQSHLSFAAIHHAVFVVTGEWELIIDGKAGKISAGETAFIPAGCSWKWTPSSPYSRAYLFANGDGFGGMIVSLGKPFAGKLLPQIGEVEKWVGDDAIASIPGITVRPQE